MLVDAAAAVNNIPLWVPDVMLGITAVGSIATAVASVINGLVQLRRLEALDHQRTQREIAQHQELLGAIATNTVPQERAHE